MASSINADNGVSSGSAGLKSSADSSGVLALQTNGTTALSIDASQNVSFTNQPTYSGGTANGVAYLNGSKVLTTGSALVFDGTNLGVGVTPVGLDSRFKNVEVGTNASLSSILVSSTNLLTYVQHNSYVDASGATKFKYTGGSNYASQYNQNNGSHVWQTSTAAGTGGNACTFTTNMTLDSAGNLGLGATPSAWGSGSKALQINSNLSLWSQSSTNNYIYANAYFDGTNDKYVSTAEAARVRFAGATTIFYYAASGTAGTNISWSESLRIDTSGNLLVGTTSSSFKLAVTTTGGDGASITNGAAGQALRLSQSSANPVIFRMNNSSNNFWDTQVNTDNSISWDYNDSEKARITSDGVLLIGVTSRTGGSVKALQTSTDDWSSMLVTTNASGNGLCSLMQRTASTGTYIAFNYGSSGSGTTIGAITNNGTSNVQYLTSSDYRLKENIQPMTGALEKVAQLKPVTYTWKSDALDGDGFIAHELAEVCPNAVYGEKDAVDEDGNPKYQGIDTSFLVATLTAAIQEMKAIIDTQASTITQLQADVAALKGA